MNKFIQFLSSLHETIKFTHEMSYSQIDFFDTTVKFGHNRGLITTLYNKPTDTHLYLEHSSSHPNSILTKGQYGQYLRLSRLYQDIDFESNAKTLTGYYLKRGYPFSSPQKHFPRARKFNLDEFLDIIPKESTDIPVMVTQFNPRNPKIGSLVRDNWNIIQNTEELTQIFKTKPLIGYRSIPNLKDIFTSSSVLYPPVPEPLTPVTQFLPICTRLGRCTVQRLRNCNKSLVSTLRKHSNVRHSLPNTISLVNSQM